MTDLQIFYSLAGLTVLLGIIALFEQTQSDNLKKWLFVLWTVTGPLFALWYWEYYGAPLKEDSLIKPFQYRQKLYTDVWSAGTVMLGVIWGIKKVQLLMGGDVAQGPGKR
jgi:uncharacterized membrane protein